MTGRREVQPAGVDGGLRESRQSVLTMPLGGETVASIA